MPRARENICLTGKQLWELLLEKGARKPRAKWTLSNGALALLAWNVGIRAQHHHGLQPARPAYVATLRDPGAHETAEALREHVERRLAAMRQAHERWEGEPTAHPLRTDMLEGTEQDMALLRNLLLVLENTEPALRTGATPLKLKGWRDHAISLAQAFVEHYRNDNPGRRPIGISEGGPVASFVWAVVPLITQEAPTLNYVTVYLKEHAQEILAVPALMIPATDRKG